MRKVLVTGATGFVGYHVVAALSAAGFAVRALIRRRSRLDFVRAWEPELVDGDITRPQTLAAAVHGVEAVVHCAGLTRARHAADFFAVNAEGTRHVCQACAEQAEPPPHLIVIGSLAALGPAKRPDAPVAEDARPNPVGPYGESKLAAQQIAASFRPRLPVTILIPPAVYGPADVDFLGCFRLIKHGFAPVIGRNPRTLSLLYAGDLARAVVTCLENRASRQKNYLLEDGQPHAWGEVTTLMGQIMDRHPRTIRLPETVGWAMACAGGLWGTLSGRPPVLNPGRMREFVQPCWVCSGQRIRDELGFAPQCDLVSGLRETHDWYRNRGWL